MKRGWFAQGLWEWGCDFFSFFLVLRASIYERVCGRLLYLILFFLLKITPVFIITCGGGELSEYFRKSFFSP